MSTLHCVANLINLTSILSTAKVVVAPQISFQPCQVLTVEMGSSIEDIARSWLLDPAWQKVFKHTFDIVKDYVSYALVAVGAITLSVRLLTTLSSGDLVCIIIGNHTMVTPSKRWKKLFFGRLTF